MTTESISANDVKRGKLAVRIPPVYYFLVIIALVGVSSGFTVSGGAEGVGRATTRAVVMSISWLVIADMVFTYFLNR